MTPEGIEAAAAANEDARGRLAGVEDVLRRVVRKALKSQKCGEQFSVEDLVAEAAPEAMAVVLGRAEACGCSPPWPSPRYRLPDDRTGVTGTLRMGGGELLDLTAWVNFYQDDRPAEIFVEKGKDQSSAAALLDALAVAVSIGLQSGVPWEVFETKLRGWRFPPSGVTDDADDELRIVASPLDYLFKWAGKKINERAAMR